MKISYRKLEVAKNFTTPAQLRQILFQLNLHILLHVPVTDTVESRSEIVFEENIDSDLLNLDFENVQEITNQISEYERNENISVNLPVNSCETVMNKENIFE